MRHGRLIGGGVALTALLALATGATAQGRAGGAGGPRLAGAAEAVLIERNATELGVGPETLAAVKTAGVEGRKDFEEKLAAVEAARAKLDGLLAVELPDEAALLRQSDEMGHLWAEALKSRMRTSIAIRALLTPEQRTKLIELRKTPRRRRAGPGPPVGPPPGVAVDRAD